MKHERNSISISGGTFQGSAVGIGHVESHGATVGAGPAAIDELRARLAAGADEIIALGRDDDERAEIKHELRKIGQELAAEEPDGAAVTTRWASVVKVLDGVLAAGTKLAGITDLVRQVFNG